MNTIAQTSLADLEHEMAGTRRTLERFPDDKGDYQPHEKSATMAKLAAHVAGIPMLGVMALTTPEIDFMQPRQRPADPTDAAGMVSLFDEGWAKLKTALAESSNEALMEKWTMRAGERVVMSLPRAAVMRSLIINHMIHHRAQLTVYYRLNGVSVPGLYGPSADEPFV
jgi:uncharacterized damage-inducible protein DinB